MMAAQNGKADEMFQSLIKRRIFTKDNIGLDLKKGGRKSWKSAVRALVGRHVRDSEGAEIIRTSVYLSALKGEKIRGKEDLKKKHPDYFQHHSQRQWTSITSRLL